jgi:hypothetical protein
MKRKRPEIGDIIEIKTPKGLAYAQYTHRDALYGNLLRVLPGLYERQPNTRILRVIGLLAVMATLPLTTSCKSESISVGELWTESQSVALNGAESVRVELQMGAGTLKVAGGTGALLNADFTYNVAEWKPQVKYDVTDGQGVLTIQQPSGSHGMKGKVRYEWELRLKNDVPIDLNVELGAGKSELQLGSLSLTGLNIERGAGEIDLDLVGDWKRDLPASIEAGVGMLTVRLPKDTGVRVEVEKGIGIVNASGLKKEGNAYINDAFGKSEITLRIHIEAGVGMVRLEVGK